jgi:hypothetical protein
MPKAPAPARAMRMGFLSFVVLQDHVADRRVRRGHMIEAVLQVGFGPPATSAIAPRAISHITSSMPSLPASRT